MTSRGRRWQAYHGRAESVLRQLNVAAELNAQVTLLLTDPPYGNGYQSGYRAEWSKIEGNSPADREQVYEVLTQAVRYFRAANQHLYVFGAWDLTKIVSVFKQAELIWDKGQPGMGDLDMTWGPSWEPIQFAAGHKSARSKSEALLRKRRGTVLRCAPVTGTRASRHPNEKPVPLLRELIEMSSQPGDLVLDTYMGSGSTGVAALLEGRRFAGIESDGDHFKVACKRLAHAESLWDMQTGA